MPTPTRDSSTRSRRPSTAMPRIQFPMMIATCMASSAPGCLELIASDVERTVDSGLGTYQGLMLVQCGPVSGQCLLGLLQRREDSRIKSGERCLLAGFGLPNLRPGPYLIWEGPADRRTHSPGQSGILAQLRYLGTRAPIEGTQANGRIQIGGRNTNSSGRCGQATFGLTHVGTTANQRPTVADRN